MYTLKSNKTGSCHLQMNATAFGFSLLILPNKTYDLYPDFPGNSAGKSLHPGLCSGIS